MASLRDGMGSLVPPPPSTLSHDAGAYVEFEFVGNYGLAYGPDAAMAFRGVRSFSIERRIGGSGDADVAVRVSLAVSTALTQIEAIQDATERLEAMPCFYRGVLMNALDLSITYRRERYRVHTVPNLLAHYKEDYVCDLDRYS